MSKKNIIFMLIAGAVLSGLSAYTAFGYENVGSLVVNFCKIFFSVVVLVACMCLLEKIKANTFRTFSRWMCNVGHVILVLLWGYFYNLAVYSYDKPISLSTYAFASSIVLLISSVICWIYLIRKFERSRYSQNPDEKKQNF